MIWPGGLESQKCFVKGIVTTDVLGALFDFNRDGWSCLKTKNETYIWTNIMYIMLSKGNSK